MASLSEIMYGRYLEDEYGYQIDAGDGGGLNGAVNRKYKTQVLDPSDALWQGYTEWEGNAPSGPPYEYGGPPISEICAGLSEGGAYVPGYNEYIGYGETKDCSTPGCFGDWKYTSWTGDKVCAKIGKWSGGRCAKLEEVNTAVANLRKGYYEGTLKPFYANVNSVGGFTQYAYNPFPLSNQEAERAFLEGREVRWWEQPDESGLKDSCQFIIEGAIKRAIEASYIAGFLAVAPKVIDDIANTYAFYAQRFIDNFKPYNPPPPPPPGDGLS